MSTQSPGDVRPIVGLWLLVAALAGGWFWATNISEECTWDAANGPFCFFQTLIHGAASVLGWAVLGLAVLTLVATVVVVTRRLTAR